MGDADAGDDGYVAIEELLDEQSVKSPACPLCKTALVSKGKPLHSKGQRYTYYYACPQHGEMLLTLRLHRNFNDTWRAKRTLRLADEETLAAYREGLEKTNFKRKISRRRKPKSRRHAQIGAE